MTTDSTISIAVECAEDAVVVTDGRCRITVRRVGDTLEVLANKVRTPKLLSIAAIIVCRQLEHFAHGGEIVPMDLDEVASELGVDASTISRANRTILSSERGSHPFKHYFPSSRVRTKDGPDVTGNLVARMIKALVEAEDRMAPFSDDKLMQLLADNGVVVARRTVAKYREQLEIPSSAERRARQ